MSKDSAEKASVLRTLVRNHKREWLLATYKDEFEAKSKLPKTSHLVKDTKYLETFRIAGYGKSHDEAKMVVFDVKGEKIPQLVVYEHRVWYGLSEEKPCYGVRIVPEKVKSFQDLASALQEVASWLEKAGIESSGLSGSVDSINKKIDIDVRAPLRPKVEDESKATDKKRSEMGQDIITMALNAGIPVEKAIVMDRQSLILAIAESLNAKTEKAS